MRFNILGTPIALQEITAPVDAVKGNGAAVTLGEESRKEPRPMLGELKTKSVIAKWYLTKFRGLKVAYRVVVPQFVILGMVIYTTAWVIVPA